MEKNLIWVIKSSMITPTRKNLEELSKRDDLFDESKLNPKSRHYISAVRSFNKAAQMGYSVVTFIDKEYPECLRKISLPPAVLYVRGNVGILNGMVYAGIVGCRKCDDYGKQMAALVAREVGLVGAGVVSGGAEGVDAAAHDGALRVNAPTIAVMGSGLDVIYPACNKELFDRIEQRGGAVISEFPFGTPPKKTNFPHRNRIIAAFSTAVVLTRAKYRSGGLITVRQALEMNKTVFAIPGNIDSPLSAGTNALIRDGALLLISPMDVIDELILKEPDFFVKEKETKIEYKTIVPERVKETSDKSAANITLSEYESEVVNIIESGHNTLSLIEENISFEGARLTALLSMMEIKGIIKKKSDKTYTIIGGKC